MMISSAYNFLVARDLIDGGLAIPDKAQAKVTYTLSLAIPGSGSPLRNLYNQVISQAMSLNLNDSSSFGNGLLNITTTAGNLYSTTKPTGFADGATVDIQTNGYRGDTGIDNHGVVVGSSNTGVLFNDYSLIAPILNGGGGGQLSYARVDAAVDSWADPVFTIGHARTMTNSSGGDVTVRESGIIGEFDGTRMTLTCRDVFSDVVVANGETIEVDYQFQVTYP